MPTSGSSNPDDSRPGDPRMGAKAFDGEEPTEVMPPKGASPSAAVAAAEPENKDKQYVAPTSIPVGRVPDRELEGAKVVLNIPEPSKDVSLRGSGVAEQRARRRAPTVKIARGALGAEGGPHRIEGQAGEALGALEPHPIPVGAGGRSAKSDELTTPDHAAIRIPIDVTVDDPELLRELGVDVPAASPSGSRGRITPAKPISASPPPMSAVETPPPFTHVRTTSAPPRASRPNEPLAQSIPVAAAAPRERSRLPWVALALLTLGGIGAAIFVVTNRPGAETLDAAPQAARREPSATSTALAATTQTAGPSPSAAPTTRVAELDTATAEATTSGAPASAAKPPVTPSSVVAIGGPPHPPHPGTPPGPPLTPTPRPAVPPTTRPPTPAAPPTAKPAAKPSISSVPVGI